MRLLVVATIPAEPGCIVEGDVTLAEDGALQVGDRALPACQGTAAMLGAAAQVARHLGTPPPYALLGGDVGRGDGTRAVYERLQAAVATAEPSVVAFHYVQPIMALMRCAADTLRATHPEIALVADAGGMYAAKASGVATSFELMTPDVGEIGFLADGDASHPAYVAHYLFGNDGFDPVELARVAYERQGAARALLIKGVRDHIALEGEVVERVEAPCVPALEAIGGTGDTVTGLAAGFMAAGFPTVDAAVFAARANREAGSAMQARPDHHARDLVARLPEVLAENLCRWGGACAV